MLLRKLNSFMWSIMLLLAEASTMVIYMHSQIIKFKTMSKTRYVMLKVFAT